MASSRIVYNERAWGADLNVEINAWLGARNSSIKRSSSEQGVKSDSVGESTLFPDILLLSESSDVVMGWELKFPDTPVTDLATFENACEKASRLGTNSFLLWNYNEALLYVLDDTEWRVAKSFALSEKVSRSDISSRSTQWHGLLHEILTAVVELRAAGEVRDASLEVFLGEPTYKQILEANVAGQADLLRDCASRDRVLDSAIRVWAEESTNLVNPKPAEIFQLLAEVQSINWINKIIFSHYLKTVSEDAYLIDTVNHGFTLTELQDVLETISQSSDFKAIFSPVLAQEYITTSLLESLLQLNELLKSATQNAGGMFQLADSLSSGMQYLRGKVSGQFATPDLLARLLVGVTMTDTFGAVIDPCCGSGTIARNAWETKKRYGQPIDQISRSVWASDKFSIPVGFTGVALADPYAMGEVEQVFQRDVADLRAGIDVEFIDPNSGAKVARTIPRFDTVVSNLPFVRFENIGDANDKEKLQAFAAGASLDGKSDLYSYILLGLKQLLSENGRLGVIVSNSFMGTKAGSRLRALLLNHFQITLVITSGNQRWFNNADVITSIIVLDQKGAGPAADTTFVSTLKRIEEWSPQWVDDVIDSVLTGRAHSDLITAQVPESVLAESGIYWPYLGEMGSSLKALVNCMVPISDKFEVGRGLRPNGEKYFFLSKSEATAAQIEPEYLIPLLHRPRFITEQKISSAEPNHFLVYCDRSTDELQQLGHTGVLAWISRFGASTNGKGTPFPEVLASERRQWYTPDRVQVSDMFVQMNPSKVFATYRPSTDQAVASQRLITLKAKNGVDVELHHALLNSTVFALWQEITGFPKGLGALDRSSTSLADFTYIPNASEITPAEREEILEAFNPISVRPAQEVFEELRRQDRRNFDEVVHRVTGIDVSVDRVYGLLERFVSARINV